MRKRGRSSAACNVKEMQRRFPPEPSHSWWQTAQKHATWKKNCQDKGRTILCSCLVRVRCVSWWSTSELTADSYFSDDFFEERINAKLQLRNFEKTRRKPRKKSQLLQIAFLSPVLSRARKTWINSFRCCRLGVFAGPPPRDCPHEFVRALLVLAP